MNAVTYNWQELNQRYLTAALAKVRIALQQYIARSQGNDTVEITEIASEELEAIASVITPIDLAFIDLALLR